MPSKVHDRSDRDEPSSKSRDKTKHRRVKRKSSSKDYDSGHPDRSSTFTDLSTRRRSSMPVPELQRRSSANSLNESKTSLPYPSFSKAHSREAVGSKGNVASARQNIYTPDPTDLQQRSQKHTERAAGGREATANGPPSPPLTAVDQAAVVEDKRLDLKKHADELRKKFADERAERDNKLKPTTARASSTRGSPWRSTKHTDKFTASATQSTLSTTPTKAKPVAVVVEEESSLEGRQNTSSPSDASSSKTNTMAQSTLDSNSTFLATDRNRPPLPFTQDEDDGSSPNTDPDSSPKTPTPRGTPFPHNRKDTSTPAYIVPIFNNALDYEQSPQPPPPPPPPIMPFQMPKVDYLMQYGGLTHSIPKSFLFAPDPGKAPQGITHPGEQPELIKGQVEKIFAPFNNLLEDYTKVVSKDGSLAVATGYRSVARRLLDRLEAVFARDISSEICTCIVCQSYVNHFEPKDEQGVSWGEILEYVCGRRELPQWPAFTLDVSPVGLGISAAEQRIPMQKLDIDVPEEYRDHYIRQSKKTKTTVDRWLASQPIQPSSPPGDVDDETLTFAMLTHLEPEQRPIFTALLGIVPSRPASRATTATPIASTPPTMLKSTALAIQRLYRLSSPPRDPECAIYLLKNPRLHNVLATLAAISDGEWEILISGRFDGFLRSGAEDSYPVYQSRGPTPAGRTSRGPSGQYPTSPTPVSATVGGPVALDEETEIAVLADVERDIYQGMEALEDAFEALHNKAELVRKALLQRSAGLSIASQARRGGYDTLDARLGTPASGIGVRGWDSETDDGIDDGISELAPDDSASNVSSSRHRRPKRRNERRTPAPVEEEDEEGSDLQIHVQRKR
ncbi:MAG: hypothetical protein MMC33_007979 [Icmadophila ericetorum]|nr:hypothetical protein [Icmadophila ericetorum]